MADKELNEFSVELSTGKVVRVDPYRITRADIKRWVNGADPDEYDALLAKITGEKVDFIESLPAPDWTKVDQLTVKALANPGGADPN